MSHTDNNATTSLAPDDATRLQALIAENAYLRQVVLELSSIVLKNVAAGDDALFDKLAVYGPAFNKPAPSMFRKKSITSRSETSVTSNRSK